MKTHERLLGSAGTSWDGLSAIPDSWYESSTAAGFRTEISEFVQEEFASKELFVVKDPRVSLFVPVWLKVLRSLDIEPLPVLVLRNPIEVTASLMKRNGFSEARSYFLWLRYMLEAESSTRSTRRSFVLYERLLEQWEDQSSRLFNDLGLPWRAPGVESRAAISRFLSPSQRHHFSSREDLEEDPGMAEWFPAAYRLLRRLEADPHDDCAMEELEVLRGNFKTASRVFFPLLTQKILEPDDWDDSHSPNWESIQAFLTMQVEAHQREAQLLRRQLEESRQELASLEKSNRSLRRESDERSTSLANAKNEAARAEQSAGRLRGELRRANWQLAQWVRKAGSLAVQLGAVKSNPLRASPALLARARRLFKWASSLVGLEPGARGLYRRIGASGLFDTVFYAEQLGLADDHDTNLLDHYVKVGSFGGLRPNPLFDPAFYLRTNEDVANAGMHPVDHYLRFGAAEGRSPHPLFDTRLYRELYPEIVASRENPLAHYLRVGGHEIHRRAHPLFDPEFYCNQYPDVAQFNINPLAHYLKYGSERQLRPNADFDPVAYEAKHPEIARSDVTPLEHFAEFGVWSAGEFARPNRDLLAEPEEGARSDLQRVSRWKTLSDPAAIDRNTKLNQLLNSFEHTVSERPIASIVIPVFGQLDLTVHCLWSLSQFRNRTPCEVIVINDRSRDETKEVLQLIPGLRLLDNDINSGFVVSCNRGAKAARGEFVVFLNNDTAVMDDWLDEMVSVFRRIPEAGFVSSKLLYPDGTLQEAGCVVWDDGSAWNLGRNGDPNRPEYNFLRDTHYGSGASVMTPATLFRELGGFDLAFQPGYYEDVDYAYSVRSAGRRVIYQPASQLIHFEGQTGGTDVSTGAKQYQIVNRERFKRKWADALTSEQPESVPIYKADAKDARAHVLFIEPTFLTPDQDAGSAMSFNLIRALVRQGMKVTFVASENLDYDSRYTSLLQDEGVECLYRPYYENLDDVLKRRPDAWDYIFIARLHCITEVFDDVRAANPSAKIIYQTIDLSSLRERRELELGLFKGSKRDVEEKEAVELKYIEACDKSIIVSTFERDLLASRGLGDKVASMPLLAYDYPPPELDNRQGVMFIGGFRHRPNIDAVQFLAEEIAPLVLDVDPEQTFYIVGGDVPDELKKLASPNILFMGQIEDPDSFFLGMRLSIAPLRYGAGIKGKVIQSLSAGLPCVGTNLAAEGIGDAEATGLWIADDAHSIAEGIVKYTSDDEAWLRAAQRGYEFARLRYSREALARDVESFVKTLA